MNRSLREQPRTLDEQSSVKLQISCFLVYLKGFYRCRAQGLAKRVPIQELLLLQPLGGTLSTIPEDLENTKVLLMDLEFG